MRMVATPPTFIAWRSERGRGAEDVLSALRQTRRWRSRVGDLGRGVACLVKNLSVLPCGIVAGVLYSLLNSVVKWADFYLNVAIRNQVNALVNNFL